MKKLSLFLFLIFSFSLKGQVWVDQGAEWHYNFSALNGGGFVKINYTGDTIIAGHTCQKLLPIEYRFTIDQNQQIIFLGSHILPLQFTYASGDTVFYFTNNDFYVLYNFGAQPGDTWNLGVDTNSFSCSASYAHVDSIGMINIHGTSYRWISLSPVTGSSVSLWGMAIERFGSAHGYLFPVNNNCDTSFIVEFENYSFSCFEDTTFQLYNLTSNDCEYLLSIDNPESKELLIYPNPTSGKIQIEGPKINSLKVFTLTGNKVLEQSNNEFIDLEDKDNGIYFISATTDKGIINKKIIKINVR